MDKVVDLITLPLKIKSRNEIDKLHWARKSDLKKEYALLIRNQMRLNKIREIKEPERATLSILSLRKRLLDHDNLVGGCKQLIDALCSEGFIYDDCPNWLKYLNVEQVKSGQDSIVIKRIV